MMNPLIASEEEFFVAYERQTRDTAHGNTADDVEKSVLSLSLTKFQPEHNNVRIAV